MKNETDFRGEGWGVNGWHNRGKEGLDEEEPIVRGRERRIDHRNRI